MPGDPKDCRRHAAYCAELAIKGRTPRLKEMFWELSKNWEMLAIQHENAFAKNTESEATRESLYELRRLSGLPIWNRIGVD
jgi:hypothetical protein